MSWDDGASLPGHRASRANWQPDWAAMDTRIVRALRDAGIDAQFRVAVHPTRQPRPPAWENWSGPKPLTDAWIVSILLAQPVGLFLQGFFQEAGKAAYDKLAELARGLSSAPTAAAQAFGDVRISAREGGQSLALPSRPSREAVDQLRKIDWSDLSGDETLFWNEPEQRWFSAVEDRPDQGQR